MLMMASPSRESQPPLQANRRVEQACGRCRRKKIRCDNSAPACSPCETQGALCVYSQPRRRGKGKTQEYVGKLEQRIESLEALLRPAMLEPASSALLEGPVGHGDLPFGIPSASWMPDTETNGHETVPNKDTIASERSCRQTSTASERARSNPSTSNNSPIPLKPPPDFLGMSIAEHDFNALRDSVSSRLPVTYNFAPMLPISELVRMVEIFLEDFNATFPIFNNRYLVSLCHRKGQEPSNLVDPAWWACMNTIIAMVTQSRATNSAFQKVSEFSWGYFKNAFSVFGEIVAMEPSMLALQAILTMASFMSRSSDLRTAILLTSTVMRMIQLMGLHKEDSSKLSLAEAEQHRCVVWAAFLLDTTLSVKAGQSLSLGVSEIQLELPAENLIDDTESLNALDVVNPTKIFVLRIQLAIIYSEAHKILLRGHFMQDECLDLWMDLEAWEGSVPTTIRPGSNDRPKASSQEPSVLLLHLAYYDCISLMHTITDLRNSPSAGVTSLPAQAASSIDFPPVYVAYSCAKVARATLSMTSCMDAVVFVDIWIALPSLLAAAFSLISDVFADPNGDHAIENIKLMASFVQFLENLQRQGCDIRRLSEGFAKLLRISKSLIFNEQCILHEAVRDLLSTTSNFTTSYRDFSQGLMTNLPKLEVESYVAAATVIFGPSKKGTCVSSPLLAPDHLMPSTFNFGMTSNRH